MTEKQKNCLVVSLSHDTSEIKQLADTLGYHVVNEFTQHRNIPEVNSYVGPGKVDEIKEYIDGYDDDIDLIIIDGELRPSQWFFLEKKLEVNVYDRIRLILAIFAERAERKEAKLQVKLAQLHYERPFVRELIHRARAGEHPGFMAGGEYQVDDYYEMIKRQIKKIGEDLEKIRNDREVHRQTRYKSGFFLVSLAGYTNAGKSSLLNILSNEQVKVEGRLFSTLSTTTRKIESKIDGKKIPILLTDTVGFIQNLPSWVIDAFHSTLEELQVADAVVLLVDGSDEKRIVAKKLTISLEELRDIGVAAPVIVALNKIDLIPANEVGILVNYIRDTGLIQDKQCVPISIKENRNINILLDTVYAALPNMIPMKLQLPLTKDAQAFVSQLYEKARVIHITYTDSVVVDIECNGNIKDKLQATCLDLGGSVL